MSSVLKIYLLFIGLFLFGFSSAADPVSSKIESNAYPKGYYNGDKLPEKIAYLTFDDGPSEWTEGILDALKQENVKATFFISAYWNNKKMKEPNSFQKHKSALKRIVKEGHVLGNHTFGHKVLTTLSAAEIASQLSYNQGLLNNAMGGDAPVMTILRTPLGYPWSRRTSLAKKIHVGSVVRNSGIVAMWTKRLDSTDSWGWAGGEWYRQTPGIDRNNPSYIKKKERIFNRVISAADGRGMVILMHDTHPTTEDVLSSIIVELKIRGYRFCTMEDFVVWKYGKSSRELLGIK